MSLGAPENCRLRGLFFPRRGDAMLQFVCENAVVLAIIGMLTTLTVTLGWALLESASRFAF